MDLEKPLEVLNQSNKSRCTCKENARGRSSRQRGPSRQRHPPARRRHGGLRQANGPLAQHSPALIHTPATCPVRPLPACSLPQRRREPQRPAAGAQPPAPPPGTATSRRAAAGKRATCTALPSTHTHPSNMPCEAAACAQPPAAAARAATPGSGGPAASATPRHGDITAGCGRQTGHLHSTPQHSYTPQQHAL